MATQKALASALLRKSARIQRRNCCTNACILITPVLFCVMLALIQLAVNKSLDDESNECGCKCVSCSIGGVTANDCPQGAFDTCFSRDATTCGLQYSDAEQSAFCGIPYPSQWPPFQQVPEASFRAGRVAASRPPVPMMWTADAPDDVQPMMDRMYNPVSTDLSALAQSCTDAPQTVSAAHPGLCAAIGEALDPPGEDLHFRADVLNRAGLPLGSPSEVFSTIFLDEGFLSGDPVYVLADGTCDLSLEGADFLTAYVFGEVRCDQVALMREQSPADINEALYCGWQEARCEDKTDDSIFEYSTSFDLRGTTTAGLKLDIWHNDTYKNGGGSDDIPTVQRVNQPLALLGRSFIEWAVGPDYTMRLNGLKEMPQAASSLELEFSSLLGPLFYLWVIELLLPVALYQLVYEKENGLRMMMKMHGMSDGVYWLVSYLWNLLLYLAFIVVLLVVGSLAGLKFFTLNSYPLQILFYFMYGNVQIALTFLLSSVFKSSRTAVVAGFIWVFGTGLLGSLMFEAFVEQDKWFVPLIELVPAFGAYRGLYELGQYSFRASYQGGDGLTFGKLGDDDNGMARVLLYFLVQWPLFIALAWYLEQVLGSGTGVRKHWLFCFSRRGRGHARGAAEAIPPTVPEVAAERDRVLAITDYEGHNPIIIKDLVKVFPAQDGNPAKVAVQGLTLAVAKGECFGLLGPNGAGKSTSINMMTGFLEATNGTCLIDGLNIDTNMDQIYPRMGVCPQHDLLWGTLTAAEHLRFYGRLKGLKGDALRAEVESSLTAVNLAGDELKSKLVKRFSGGMKRRLSVAVAFMGSPRCVYLDECTTGLDPASRRALWDVVKEQKKGRAVVLTTHSMEEAGVLCDRLGIFVDGRLVCLGSGKQLTALHGDYLAFSVSVREGQEKAAVALIKELCPDARLTYEVSGTLKFEFPLAGMQLSRVFDFMEASKRRSSTTGVDVLDWGVANATLEEVFIKLARAAGAAIKSDV